MSAAALAADARNPAEEDVAIVDENDIVVGTAKRRQMRAERLRHRATYILVFNSRDEIYVQRRTDTKDYCPGYWDPVAGGVMGPGEEYAEGAAREAEEELGVTGVPLRFAFKFYYEDERVRCFGSTFACIFDGPIVWQPSEVQGGEWVPIADIEKHMRENNHTPDGIACVKRYLSENQHAETKRWAASL
jgi:8-oxo-dGTP pyrophosphatase MutT (NUDIX family)